MAQIPKIIEFLGRDPFEQKAESFGDRIRDYRRVHVLTQKKLAEQLGVDQTTIGAWEKGLNMPSKQFIDTLQLLILDSSGS